MADSDITRLDYGGKIPTDAARMAAGMIEMFDEMADLALSRIIARTASLEQGFDLAAVSQDDIGRFKISWLASLGELMFHGLPGAPQLAEIRRPHYPEIEISASAPAIGRAAGGARV